MVMITRLSHASFYVLDQEEAYDFYVNKLGFDVREDADLGEGMRWLTVSPREQSELEITLMPASAGMSLDEEQAGMLRDLIEKGAFGFGVFESADIYATYEELKEKGVKFKKAPTEEFYGIEAIFQDPFGNWFSLVQRD